MPSLFLPNDMYNIIDDSTMIIIIYVYTCPLEGASLAYTIYPLCFVTHINIRTEREREDIFKWCYVSIHHATFFLGFKSLHDCSKFECIQREKKRISNVHETFIIKNNILSFKEGIS